MRFGEKSMKFSYNIIEANFKLVTYTDVWSDCIRFEYIYGSHKLVKEIYKASLRCLETDLRITMTEEFEKLKKEFMYVLFI